MLPRQQTGSGLSRADWLCWFAVMAAFALQQFSFAHHATGGPLASPAPRNYYHFATEALLSGQFSLKVLPRPELLKLADPYDPSLNAPYRLLDMSLYRGRYYFYWGLTPVILLFGPWFLLTHCFLSEAAASALFALGCQGCLAWLLLACRRAYFPKTGACLTGLGLLCIGVASFLPLLAMANSVYGVPVAAAAFCQAFAWCCIYRALHSPTPLTWALLAGIGVALALDARPIYVLWSASFFVPLWALLILNSRDRVRLTLAAAAPPLLGVAAMLAMNCIRFGRFTEFGMHYQLTASGPPDTSLTWSHIAANWRVYGWNPPLFSRYFPFLSTPRTGACGMLSALPVVYAALGIVRMRRFRLLSPIAGMIALAGFGGFLALAAFPGAAVHYTLDFLPACVLAGALGAFALADMAARKGWLLPRLGLGLAFAASLATALLLQMEGLGAWRETCERLRPVSRVLNAPIFLYEHLTKTKPGPLLLRFTLPRNRTGAFEPLVSIGSRSKGGEVVFIEYIDDRHVRLGFFQTDTTHWLSPPRELDFSRVHELYVSLGSLLPPDSDPVFARWSEAATESAQQDVTLVLDGQLIYKTSLDFGIRHGERYWLGENRVESGVSQPRFTGEALEARVAPLSPAGPRLVAAGLGHENRFGGWRITVRFPTGAPKGSHDPIIVSGVPGAADFIYAFYPQSGAVAFGHDSWGFGGSVSRTIAIDPEREYAIEVRYGGLYPPGEPNRMKNRLSILLDGAAVMDQPEHTYDAPPETVTPAENRIGGSTTGPAFSGRVISAQRLGD